ncbi:chromosome partitioning protein ParA [Pandoraea sp. XJJ-1]|uniref:chromosome partitioning protein ParA n=1 Tax=Pandoraea sp. XJJ-1 TaxID=3002643 RepID=UPI00227E363C|nr:chromosome partitioning protein ParA [Pandoraea sp. XJJ-1]WAL81317.1 chromosome partitioning protein ParA [Pandoraea sp. XJJ-1]
MHGDDSRLYVEFTMEAIHQTAESEKQGRPIFKDVPHIQIHFPGDRTKKIFRPVKMEDDMQGPADPRRFPKQWSAFEAQREQVQDGTPIEQWGPITKSQAMELKSMHIHTVEQLAGIADSNLTWLGARQLRDKAEAWLKQADNGKEAMRLQAENDQLREDMALLQQQMRDLAARVEGHVEHDKEAAASKKSSK